MAKLNTYIVHAQYREETESEIASVLNADYDCRLRVKAGDITEAIEVAQKYIGAKYSIDSASMNGGYVNVF